MFRLSSNTTLFWKLFFPTFYLTFFGLLILVSFLADSHDLPLLANPLSRSLLLIFYFSFILFMWFTILSLKRVEIDADYLYVSNYYHTYRYAKTDIENQYTKDYFIFKVTTLVMKDRTKMGKKIRFIGEYDVTMK